MRTSFQRIPLPAERTARRHSLTTLARAEGARRLDRRVDDAVTRALETDDPTPFPEVVTTKETRPMRMPIAFFVLALCLLAAAVANADDRRCPRPNECVITLGPPASAISHICVFPADATPQFDANRCKAVADEVVFEEIVPPGDGDEILALYSYREDIDAFSDPAPVRIEIIDLAPPTVKALAGLEALVTGLRELADNVEAAVAGQ